MKKSAQIVIYISTLIAAIVITAFTTYFLTTKVFSPIGPGGNGDNNPVNIAADTKVFWNGKDITKTWTHNIKYDGLVAESIYGDYDLPPELYCPVADFAGTRLSAGALPGVDTKNAIALLWTFDDVPYTYARNGKTVKSISFSGLDDNALVALTLDGVILRVPDKKRNLNGEIVQMPDAEHELYWEVKDSRGVTNGLTFVLFGAPA